jgi:hypothetical protein
MAYRGEVADLPWLWLWLKIVFGALFASRWRVAAGGAVA